jgi:hypothetical protein
MAGVDIPRDVHSKNDEHEEAQRAALALQAFGDVKKDGRDQVANSSACSSVSMSENEAEIEGQEAVIYPGHR